MDSAVSNQREVRLSAILNVFDGFVTIRKTVRHLCAQTIRDQLEIVFVTTPSTPPLPEIPMLGLVGAWQVVVVPERPTGAAGWAAGIRRARAPIVVLCEDHSFPEPGWAEAVLAAYRENFAAVAPALGNANPRSLISWANFLLCFLEWYSPHDSGPVSAGPGHNTSYNREVLLEYGGLEHWLNAERLLHFDLAAKGRTIWLTAHAVTRHVNISKPGSYLAQSYLGGRVFGAARAAHWPAWQKVMYAMAFPLIPGVRLYRIARALDSPEKRRESRFFPALPWILAGLLFHALGEAVGYLSGAGGSIQHYMQFETHRSQHVDERDRWLLTDGDLHPSHARATDSEEYTS